MCRQGQKAVQMSFSGHFSVTPKYYEIKFILSFTISTLSQMHSHISISPTYSEQNIARKAEQMRNPQKDVLFECTLIPRS